MRQGHLSFLEKEIAHQQDVLGHPPDSLLPEGILAWQASALARITAMREEMEKVKGTVQATDGPMQGQAKYDFQRLSQLGMLGNWPDQHPPANLEHIKSPASPAVTVSPLQPWSPSPPPASPPTSDEQDTQERAKKQRT